MPSVFLSTPAMTFPLLSSEVSWVSGALSGALSGAHCPHPFSMNDRPMSDTRAMYRQDSILDSVTFVVRTIRKQRRE